MLQNYEEDRLLLDYLSFQRGHLQGIRNLCFHLECIENTLPIYSPNHMACMYISDTDQFVIAPKHFLRNYLRTHKYGAIGYVV